MQKLQPKQLQKSYIITQQTHAVLACVDVDIDLRYSVKCCPAKTRFLTPQITERKWLM